MLLPANRGCDWLTPTEWFARLHPQQVWLNDAAGDCDYRHR